MTAPTPLPASAATPPSASDPKLTANQIADSDAFWASIIPEAAPAPEGQAADPPVTPAVVPPEPPPEAEAAPATEPGAEPAAEPEAAVTPEPVKEAPKKATPFTVKDAEGEVEIPDVLISFKANGEVRELPLDKVVRLAQSGFYNEKLIEEVKETRGLKAQYEQALAEAQQIASNAQAHNRALMERGDDFFIAERDKYQAQNSPEERANRLEKQLQAERFHRQQAEQGVRAQAFLEGDLSPKVSALLQEYSSVSDAEAAGWLAPQLKGLEVNGVIPPHRYDAVRRLLEDDLGPWMAHVHDQRTSTAKAVETKRQVELRKAKVETTLAKRELTKVASPAARAGAVTGTPGPSKKELSLMSAQQRARLMFKEMGFGDSDEE